MKPLVLYRADAENQNEYFVAQKYFETTKQRNAVPENSLVVARYSCLPYFRELEEDLKIKGSRLINNYRQHQWIANFDYYDVVKDYTFETWFEGQDLPEGIPLVVKGRTNSKKGWWNTKMFCENKQVAILTAMELRQDPLIGEQGVIYRRYEPLVTYEIGINEQRFTNEWRFFFYKNELLSYGYYWSHADDIKQIIDPKAIELAKEIATKCSEHVNFFVLDLAEKESGGWVLVEINDGQMSGLSENDPDRLYANLKLEMENDGFKV